MSHIYPEIKEELLRTESALEEYALKHQTVPPASLKESIFAQMNFDSSIEQEVVGEVTDNDEDIRNEEFVEIPVITNAFSKPETREVTPFWAKLAVAASVLLALFAGWSANEVSGIKKSNVALATEVEEVKKTADYSQQLAAMYRDQRYKVIRLAGLAKSPESAVAAFWDTKTNEVMLDVQKLPPAPSGKQYQLWSIVDGKPMDIGMLDQEFEGRLLKMKHTKSGSVAFAITLEKTGGNPAPTMEEMYVMGEV